MIFSNTTKKSISVISMFMVMIMGFATAFAPVSTYAAEDDGYGVGDKVKLVHDHQIRYGSGDGGYSNLMEAHGIDDSLGNRPVFCTRPNMPTPSHIWQHHQPEPIPSTRCTQVTAASPTF